MSFNKDRGRKAFLRIRPAVTQVALAASSYAIVSPAHSDNLCPAECQEPSQCTHFNFRLDKSYSTSAVVYDADRNVAVCTLLRAEPMSAGTHSLSWGNLDDSGSLVPATRADANGNPVPVSYRLLLLRHNVSYTWEGVIGNSSASFIGDTVFASANSPFSMALFKDRVYFAVGQNERQTSGLGFAMADPTRALLPFTWASTVPGASVFDQPANGYDQNVTLSMVASDGQQLYWANTGAKWNESSNNHTFVVRSDPDQATPFAPPTYGVYTSFTEGSPLCLQYRQGYTDPVPGLPYPNWCYAAAYYQSAIDVSADGRQYGATGIAVQTQGSLLAVAHGRQGIVKFFDKTSGSAVGSLPIAPDGPEIGQIAMSPTGDLWVLGATTATRYSGLPNTPTVAATITGLAHPLAISVNPSNDNIVLIADGGSSQQVKAFDRSGNLRWTYGQLGGYASDPAVSPTKLWFRGAKLENSLPTVTEYTALAVLPDGSFWIGDTAQSRLLHIGPTRKYVGQILYRPRSYSAQVDPNNPSRVFSNFLEYSVDTSSPLNPGEGRSWTLVRNWLAGVPGLPTTGDSAAYSNIGYGGFAAVLTLPNQRTYAVVRRDDHSSRLYELSAQGPARDTGIDLNSFCPGSAPSECGILENGDLNYDVIIMQGDAWISQDIYRRSLSGFDASNNPLWADPVKVASISTVDTDQPYRHYGYASTTGARFPQLPDGNVLMFDTSIGGSAQDTRFTNNGFHLGSFGNDGWRWQGSPVGWIDGKGTYQTVAVDNAIHYGGNLIWLSGSNIVYGFHGENYVDHETGYVGEANQFMHFTADGLFVGEFGVPILNAPPGELVYGAGAGQAGNSFSNTLVRGPNANSLYWYHNDESNHGGVHRWLIGDLDSMRILSGSGMLNAAIALTTPDSVSLTATPSGRAISFAAIVSGDQPTGTVQFFMDGSPLGSPTPLANGVAQLNLTQGVPKGATHVVSAQYQGDGYNQSATSSGLLCQTGLKSTCSPQ